MKKMFYVVCGIVLTLNLYGQSISDLEEYSGAYVLLQGEIPFIEITPKNCNVQATYHYYDENGKRVRHGECSYTGDGFNVIGQYLAGKKDGKWSVSGKENGFCIFEDDEMTESLMSYSGYAKDCPVTLGTIPFLGNVTDESEISLDYCIDRSGYKSKNGKCSISTGSRRVTGAFSGDELNGVWSIETASGEIIGSCSYVNGKPSGRFSLNYSFEDETYSVSAVFKNGVMVDTLAIESGDSLFEAFFDKNGCASGIWKLPYDDINQMIYEFEDGLVCNITKYDDSRGEYTIVESVDPEVKELYLSGSVGDKLAVYDYESSQITEYAADTTFLPGYFLALQFNLIALLPEFRVNSIIKLTENMKKNLLIIGYKDNMLMLASEDYAGDYFDYGGVTDAFTGTIVLSNGKIITTTISDNQLIDEVRKFALQNDNDDIVLFFTEPDAYEPPKFNGGNPNAFATWMAENVEYPEIARENGVMGKIDYYIVINADGALDIKILRSPDPSLTYEVQRVAKLSAPLWTSGRLYNRNVPNRFMTKFIFQLR